MEESWSQVTIKASSQADPGSAFQFLRSKAHSEKCSSRVVSLKETSRSGSTVKVKSAQITQHREKESSTQYMQSGLEFTHLLSLFQKDFKKSNKLRLVKSFSHFTKLHFLLNLEQNLKHLALNTSETRCITRNSLRIGSSRPPVTVWGTLGYFLRRISYNKYNWITIIWWVMG